jgi:hypothetical protein
MFLGEVSYPVTVKPDRPIFDDLVFLVKDFWEELHREGSKTNQMAETLGVLFIMFSIGMFLSFQIIWG